MAPKRSSRGRGGRGGGAGANAAHGAGGEKQGKLLGALERNSQADVLLVDDDDHASKRAESQAEQAALTGGANNSDDTLTGPNSQDELLVEHGQHAAEAEGGYGHEHAIEELPDDEDPESERDPEVEPPANRTDVPIAIKIEEAGPG